MGFGDVITPGASKISYPSLLGFEEPRLLGYTPETTIAEKFHAMVVLDMANSRMKDFKENHLTLKEAIETITVFVMPVVEALIKGQPFDRRWLPGGPWGDQP